VHARVCEGGSRDSVTVNLIGHAAGNGGYSQGTPADPFAASSTRKPHPVSIKLGRGQLSTSFPSLVAQPDLDMVHGQRNGEKAR